MQGNQAASRIIKPLSFLIATLSINSHQHKADTSSNHLSYNPETIAGVLHVRDN